MSKKAWTLVILTLLLALGGQAALAQLYSFPYAGVRLEAGDEWTVLSPGSLKEQEALLESLGADMDALAADYAATNAVFEAYLPGGMQVALTAVATEQTRAWDSMAYMTEADKDDIAAALHQPPYENAGWAQDVPGHLRYEWVLEADNIPVSFAGLMTVRQGTLYTLTASGVSVSMEALHEVNRQVLDSLQYLGMTAGEKGTDAGVAPPAAIEDDGEVTPIAFENESPISYDETTVLTFRTLPGAEITLQTANDLLRGKVGEDGLHSFSVSTRRESIYSYTVTARLQGRSESRLEVSIDRQLAPEAQLAAYRKAAQPLANIGYGNLLGAPEAYKDKSVSLRGRVGGFTDIGGFPCVLVYTENPARDVWRSPVWVVLTEAAELSMNEIYTVYGDVRGDALAYTEAGGGGGEAPVIVSRGIDKN